MLNADKEKLIKKYVEAYNAKDVDGMIACVHDEVVFKNITQGVTMVEIFGKTSLQELASQTTNLFETREQTILHISHDGDGAKADIHFEGVFAMDLPNGVKKGQRVTVDGYSEFEFRDGLISVIADCS